MNTKRGRRTSVAILLATTLAVGSCGDDDDAELPNPASEFCEDQGGTVEIERDDEGGERGVCVLPDGTRVDEWEYYRDNAEPEE